MTTRTPNFSAGPAVLPLDVLEEAHAEWFAYRDAGASILEISHRSPSYTEVAADARASLARLLGLDDAWHVLFLQGGASQQFYQVPLNLLPPRGYAGYVNTGVWSSKAIDEARRLGEHYLVATAEPHGFDRVIPDDAWDVRPGSAYVHFTSNNTIYGTQYASDPRTAGVPLVCDMSSDFLSRPIALDRYGLIYAGAQKNLGPAGVCLVLVHDDMLRRRNDDLPTLLDYGTHAAKLFHTPPVFAVWLVEKVLRWIERQGGLAAMAARNHAQARRVYDAIDSHDLYRGHADAASRSRMNVTFHLADPALEPRFLDEAAAAGLNGLKGHRSVGGLRASIYNATPDASIDALVEFLAEFARTA
jgi:phosphoserine aminotransferase